MFEKVSQVAQQVATQISRRSFLGKVGQFALALAGLLGGLLAVSDDAQAIGRGPVCCYVEGVAVCRLRQGKDERCPAGTVPGPCGEGSFPPYCY
jgi:hypothetical protein